LLTKLSTQPGCVAFLSGNARGGPDQKRIEAEVGQDDRDVENKARLHDDDSSSTPRYDQGLSEHHGKPISRQQAM
jgi:hypothetical protein